MVVRLTVPEKIEKIETSIKILNYAIDNKVSIDKASKEFGVNKRYIYNVNRRWIRKSNNGISIDLIVNFKELFKLKDLPENKKFKKVKEVKLKKIKVEKPKKTKIDEHKPNKKKIKVNSLVKNIIKTTKKISKDGKSTTEKGDKFIL